MIKKILIVFISLLFISCGSSKIRTTKKTTSTKSYPVSKRYPEKTAPVNSPKETKSSGSEILVATSKVKATTEDVKKYISDFVQSQYFRQNRPPGDPIEPKGVKALGVGEKESLNPRLIKEVLDVCSDRFEEPRLVLKR